MSSVELHDHSGEVLSAMDQAMKNALTAIGVTAERHAKEVLTREVYTGDKPWKLTGRLRNSITFATEENEGSSFSYKDDDGKTYSDKRGSGADSASVFIGTNVEYAEGIELGTLRKAGAVHFLQDAAANHSAEYKKLVKNAMEAASD